MHEHHIDLYLVTCAFIELSSIFSCFIQQVKLDWIGERLVEIVTHKEEEKDKWPMLTM